MSRNKTIVVCLVAVIVVIGLLYVFSHNKHNNESVSGSTDPSTGTSGYFTESLGSAIMFLGNAISGPNSGSNIREQASLGSCNTGSSTLFALSNPFSATSTALVQSVQGIGNATSSNLLVGTSTKSSGLVASDVSATLVNSTVGSTSPQFFTSSGIQVGPATGYTSAGATTFRTIVVGPNDNVVGYATSTYGAAGAINYSPAFTSCSYKVRWTN